jgi:transmembrane sensor
MERNSRANLNNQIYEEACEWFVEFRAGEPDASARREFDLWMRKSPGHLAAYLEIAAIWNEGPSLDPLLKWDSEALIGQAARDPDNIIPLSRASAQTSSRLAWLRSSRSDLANKAVLPSPARGKAKPFRLAVALTLLVLVSGFVTLSLLFRPPTYATAIGEQRSIALVDGSIIELNSRSKIRVRYSAQERDVDLLEGQALFHVAKDHARPFIVTSGLTHVRAVGTQFDVYMKHDNTVVTVVEGRVAILRESSEPTIDSTPSGVGTLRLDVSNRIDFNPSNPTFASAVYLSAGEQLTVTPKAEQKTAHPNVASATAWTQRELVFESASLPEVAEEFNRYNERQLIIQDPALYDFHISGVFSSTDPTSLIRFLRQRPGVKVIETGSQIRVARNIS